MSIITLTISLLAISGTAIVVIGLYLLTKGTITLTQESPGERGALDFKIPKVLSVSTRYPALGLLLIGALSIGGAVQLGLNEQDAQHAREEARAARELQQAYRLVGEVHARDPSSVSDAKITVLSRLAYAEPLDDGSVADDVLLSSKNYEVWVSTVGHEKDHWRGPVKADQWDPSQRIVRLDVIDLDKLLGERRRVAKPPSVPPADTGVPPPNRDDGSQPSAPGGRG